MVRANKLIGTSLLVAVALSQALICSGSAVAASKKSAQSNLTPFKIAETQIRTMGEAIHRMKRATSDLVAECTREDSMVGGEIDFIGTDIIPIMPATAEGFGGPVYLPPRKKYIDLHMTQIAGLLPILNDDVTGMPALNDDERAKEAPDLSQMMALMKDIKAHYEKLQALTNLPPYDAATIANEATSIHQDVNQVDKLRKDIFKIVRSDPNKNSSGAPGSSPAGAATGTSAGN
jgi:hypothetical protein